MVMSCFCKDLKCSGAGIGSRSLGKLREWRAFEIYFALQLDWVACSVKHPGWALPERRGCGTGPLLVLGSACWSQSGGASFSYLPRTRGAVEPALSSSGGRSQTLQASWTWLHFNDKSYFFFNEKLILPPNYISNWSEENGCVQAII